jgi:VanZ family protein
MITRFWTKKIGPDEELRKRYHIPAKILHAIHHREIGLIIVVIASVLYFTGRSYTEILLGMGIAIFMEDTVYHMFRR